MSAFEHDQTEPLLPFVHQLLAIETIEVREALSESALLVVQALDAEKADIFLLEQESQTLIALGVSETPLGRLQQSIGMNRLPLANKGRAVEVFQMGTPYRNGQVNSDAEELSGVKQGMGIRSTFAVPLLIGEERQGVLQVDTTQPDFFTEQDQRFLEGVAHWVGMVAHRAELLQQVARSAAEEARRGTAEELMTVLAHDLRNYLTPLQGRVDLLTRRADREQRQRDLADLTSIATTIRRFERLIADLMDTARLSQGLFILTLHPMELAVLTQEVAIALQMPSVQIEVQVPADLIVEADADRLRQVLENLLSNAVKHAPKGTSVHVQAEMREEGTRVVLLVSNQGPGIPQELLPHLFEPFHAGVGSTGLGLGLYLAQEIVLAHGGQLSVDTTYRQGTRFVLSLPVSGESHGRHGKLRTC